MIAQTTFGIREKVVAILAAALLLLGAMTVSAQTTSFTPPSGFLQDQSRPGIYFNPINQLYYNPMTGQYSALGPLGEARRNSSGAYIVGSGYIPYASTTYYHNSSTGYYYDPMTGFYSTTAPVNTGVTLSMARNYVAPGTVITPGVPNTGVGGTTALALLVLVSSLAIAGSVYLSRKVLKA